jgi:hypothetical protein
MRIAAIRLEGAPMITSESVSYSLQALEKDVSAVVQDIRLFEYPAFRAHSLEQALKLFLVGSIDTAGVDFIAGVFGWRLPRCFGYSSEWILRMKTAASDSKKHIPAPTLAWTFILNRRILVFKWTWTILSVTGCWYFGFHLFPAILDSNTGNVAKVYFRADFRGAPNAPAVTYFPNLPEYRRLFFANLGDREFFYITACDALQSSKRPDCDETANWWRETLQNLECSDFFGCKVESIRLSKARRTELLAGIKAKENHTISASDAMKVSFSDPVSWGDDARLPVFFISFFLAVKLGRALGEFWFRPFSN